jgi:hypothetical protein
MGTTTVSVNHTLQILHINKVFYHILSLHRPTSSSSSTTNFSWLSLSLFVHVLLLLLFVTCNSFTYIAEEQTWAYSKYISRDHYPASLLVRLLDLQKTHHVISVHCCDITTDTEITASSIVACWIVFTDLLPGHALIKSITII